MDDAPRQEQQPQKQWMILSMQKTLPYLGEAGGVFGAHNYLALAAPDGNIVQEMHGVPSQAFTFGTSPGNYLQVLDLKPGRYMNEQSLMSKKLVMSGTEQDMRGKYDQGYEAVEHALDDKHQLYAGAKVFGHAVNSNSVWNTALLSMGVDKPSHYDGPLATPGNSIDLRSEPSNNSLLATPADSATWKPNPARLDESKLPSLATPELSAVIPSPRPAPAAAPAPAVTIPPHASQGQQAYPAVRMRF